MKSFVEMLEIVYRHYVNSIGGYSTNDIVAMGAEMLNIDYNVLYKKLEDMRKERND